MQAVLREREHERRVDGRDAVDRRRVSEAQVSHVVGGDVAAGESDDAGVVHVDGASLKGSARQTVILREKDETRRSALSNPLLIRHPLRSCVTELLGESDSIPLRLTQHSDQSAATERPVEEEPGPGHVRQPA